MKSTSGFILSLIGGIFDVLLGFISLGLVVLLALVSSGLDLGSVNAKMADFSSMMIFVFILLALWFLVFGILSIVFSVKINNDASVKTGGICCLIFGILTVNILLIIGGIIGISASRKQDARLQSMGNLQNI